MFRRMSVIRTILLAALTALLLPWGAYASPMAGAALGGSAASAEMGDLRASGVDVASAKRDCKGKSILGAACGPDLAIATDAGFTRPAEVSVPRLHMDATSSPRRVAWAVWDPPRG
ncbi:hypothetical protein SAMN04488012_107116 [Palleronia salina]|uniref:Uncharacterized protein n=2 Tax=Palleronia salina TaxID=313368 RepID=A0A1M6IC31_9RHOB|nr:hypothetical protein SAMN04488012_107116 [Palleronia salina]